MPASCRQSKLHETKLKEGVLNAAGITVVRHEGIGKALTRLFYSLMKAGVDLETDPCMVGLSEYSEDQDPP